ncbi:class II aldolase/adducin family protein [Fangia hongkongensis]|uniref:class II aldolase/adducin family protein n=1 Tax=Fangia hongkongensis TaxID=270495 RepID=UPI00036985D5|nr:class II aldolase/adducin family protein [Fangia hongkongensis]MBK2123776.1 class II aldolase/adducin family protein [Fangia hongkongensis]
MPSQITELEINLRQKLASAHHIVHYYGWDDLLATHLSARIPDTDTLLVTPHNVTFENVTADNLVKTDLYGNIISQNSYKVMPQAVNIHAAIYRHSAHCMSAMHTHSTYGVTVSSLSSGLLFFNQQSLRFYNDVAYHDFNGLALENEGEEIVASLKGKSVMILRNHGLLTTGIDIETALYRLYYLEICCKLQVLAQSTNQNMVTISEAVCQKTKSQFDRILTPYKEFEALSARVTS